METKKSLNNTQRKMLDQIYTNEFVLKRRAIMDKRAEGLEVLKRELKEELTHAGITGEILAHLQAAFNLREEHAEELVGVRFHNFTANTLPQLSLDAYGAKHPRIREYWGQTEAVNQELNRKEREMRARIYGLDTTYDEIRADIDKLLEDITV